MLFHKTLYFVFSVIFCFDINYTVLPRDAMITRHIPRE